MEHFIKNCGVSNSITVFMQVVHSKFEDLVPKVMDEDDPELQRPDEDELAEVSPHYHVKKRPVICCKIPVYLMCIMCFPY